VCSSDSIESSLQANDIQNKKSEENSKVSIVWEHVFEQMTIEEVLLAYNQQSFRQAADSPLGSGMIYNSLKLSSLSTAALELLAGKIPDSWSIKDPRLTALLVSLFAIPDAVKSASPIKTTISEEDFVYGITGWKESTSTSPSGHHLGHYKALINDPDLMTFYVQFLNVLVSNGLSLDLLLTDGRMRLMFLSKRIPVNPNSTYCESAISSRQSITSY
jgi:hypothetical protein